jgi:hypothetical protein
MFRAAVVTPHLPPLTALDDEKLSASFEAAFADIGRDLVAGAIGD